ncbi:MAG: response regulator [Pseudomonadota bacterium]
MELANNTHGAGAGSALLATVLVVDDNEAAIELARIMLVQHSKLKCNLQSACSGEEALEFLRAAAQSGRRVDLMLLDINMPRINGFQVLSELSPEPSEARPTVVMCSTSHYDQDIERAYALGASGYIEKPPRLEKLRPLLQKVSTLKFEESPTGVALLRAA